MSKVYLPQVEVGIVRSCINACKGCNHMAPVAQPPYFMPLDVLKDDLLRLKEVADVDKLSILGGEPLLHPEIADLLVACTFSRVAKRVSVITNGQLLDCMPSSFWHIVQSIEMDVYPGKLSHQQIQFVKAQCEKHNVALKIVPIAHFCKCLRSGEGETPEQIQRRFDACPTGHLCVCLDYGYLYRCPQASILPGLLLKDQPATVDGIPLDGLTPEKLRAYLDSKTPLHSCARCSVNEAWFPWREVAREDWMKESTL